MRVLIDNRLYSYGMFVSRFADAHARVQPQTFAYRSDRHVLRTEDPHQYARLTTQQQSTTCSTDFHAPWSETVLDYL